MQSRTALQSVENTGGQINRKHSESMQEQQEVTAFCIEVHDA